MSGEQRLDRLYPALSAKERAMMVLRAGKAEQPADRAIYTTAHAGQSLEFNRLVRLMNACNVELASVLFVLREQVSKLEMKQAWLDTVHIWAAETALLRTLLLSGEREPITASQHKHRETEAREELLALAECVEIQLLDYPWSDDQYMVDEDGARVISDKQWARTGRTIRKELLRLVADGTLPHRRRGRSVSIPAGAFYDWRGEPTPVCPYVGWEYDVRPDAEADAIARDLRTQAVVREILARAPLPLPTPVDTADEVQREAGDRFGSDLERALVISIRQLVQQHWSELRAAEIGIAEVTAEFDGEDPLRPDARALLDDCLRRCEKLRDGTRQYGEFELAEPSDDDVAQVRALIENVVGAD